MSQVSPRTDASEIDVGCRSANSPVAAPTTSAIAPPASICMAVDTSARLGSAARLEYTDPVPQHSAATRTASMPARLNDRPPPSRPTVTIHSGTVATSRAATPLGMRCSAQDTSPLPPTQTRPPTMAAAAHCRAPRRSPSRSPRGAVSANRIAHQVASRGHQEGRDGSHGLPDGQVGRAPHHVHRDQRSPHPGRRGQRRRAAPGGGRGRGEPAGPPCRLPAGLRSHRHVPVSRELQLEPSVLSAPHSHPATARAPNPTPSSTRLATVWAVVSNPSTTRTTATTTSSPPRDTPFRAVSLRVVAIDTTSYLRKGTCAL